MGGQVSLYESASCGSKSAFWGPEGEAMASWTDMFTYGTEIAYDFVNIMLKHYKNLDLDGSGSLNKDEFRVSYAKMALLAAHVEMDILDANGDGILQGNELKTFTTLTVRGANVCLPGYFLSLSTSDSLPVELYVEPVEFQLDTSSILTILDSVSGYIWNNFLCPGPESSSGTNDIFNLVTKMHSQSGITNVADVYNLSKYNSRIMAAFLPEYEKVELYGISNFHRENSRFQKIQIFVENKIFFSTVPPTSCNLDETVLLGDFNC